jgi:hypothetical protein
MTLIFPTPGGQTPVNTFSPTSTPDATTNGVTYTWDGTKWTAAASGGGTSGKVLQVVQSVLGTSFSTTSTTDVATGITASITPTSASSKILITLSTIDEVVRLTGPNAFGVKKLLRGATAIVPSITVGIRGDGASGLSTSGNFSYTYLDNPATTSSVTYSVSALVSPNSSITFYISTNSTITLMEIAP